MKALSQLFMKLCRYRFFGRNLKFIVTLSMSLLAFGRGCIRRRGVVSYPLIRVCLSSSAIFAQNYWNKTEKRRRDRNFLQKVGRKGTREARTGPLKLTTLCWDSDLQSGKPAHGRRFGSAKIENGKNVSKSSEAIKITKQEQKRNPTPISQNRTKLSANGSQGPHGVFPTAQGPR